MSSFLDPFSIRQELTNFIRNSDVMTTTERGVTTDTDTGTFVAASTHLINIANVKNIRSVVVDTTTLSYGSDYTVDFTFDDSGTYKTKISFTSAQTGDYTITYDYGTDKIWPDFPRDDLSISQYPRIAIDTQDSTTDAFGIGANDYISNIIVSVFVYAQSTEKIDNLIKIIRQKIMTNSTSFFYFRYIKPTGMSPLIGDPKKRQEIMFRSIDFQSMFNVEQVN